MKKKINFIIPCPYCGAEYLPGEIFLPKTFLGEPKHIDRDDNGKIVSFVGTNMNTYESYTCDFCGTTFKIKATVNMVSRPDVKHDFSRPYKVSLEEEEILLEEN